MYDLVIIGGGPGGTAATIYASRKQLKTLLIVKEFGGQSAVSPEIFNWIGTPSISGIELADNFKKHVEEYKGDYLDIKEGESVESLEQTEDGFVVKTDEGNTYQSKTVLITSGSSRRKLDVPGAEELEGRGIVYCASCDGPLFAGQDVAVIGGGNAGFESAAQLLAYTKSVTLLHRGEKYKADKITVDKVLSHPNMTGILNAATTEIKGDTLVQGLVYKDKKSGEERELAVTGIFVEIGQIPNTSFVKDLVELDEYNRIKIDPKNQKTSVEGIWAAGDGTNVLYHQNNIAAGDGVRAIEDIYIWLHAK